MLKSHEDAMRAARLRVFTESDARSQPSARQPLRHFLSGSQQRGRVFAFEKAALVKLARCHISWLPLFSLLSTITPP